MKQGYLKKTGILCLAIVFLMAAGCGKAKTQGAEENAFNTEAEVIAWEEEEQADNEDDAASEEPDKPAPREVVDGKIRSYFTGEWIDEELGKTRPLAIMLNNTSAALPCPAYQMRLLSTNALWRAVSPAGWVFLRTGKIWIELALCEAAGFTTFISPRSFIRCTPISDRPNTRWRI